MLDVTTVMVTSEFSRTMRILDQPIDNTGTNHYSLNNTVLIGGKGIRGGLVIGASDFQTADEKLTPAHLALDPSLIKAMGRPFDFKRMKTRTDLPASFSIVDHLTINSVVNTIYRNFNARRAAIIKSGGIWVPPPYSTACLFDPTIFESRTFANGGAAKRRLFSSDQSVSQFIISQELRLVLQRISY